MTPFGFGGGFMQRDDPYAPRTGILGMIQRQTGANPFQPMQQPQQMAFPNTPMGDTSPLSPWSAPSFGRPGQKAVAQPQLPAFPTMEPGNTAPLPAFQAPKFDQARPNFWNGTMERLGEIEPETWFQMAGRFFDAGSGNATVGSAVGGIGEALAGQRERGLRKEELDWVRMQRERAKTTWGREDAAIQTAEQQRAALETQFQNDPGMLSLIRMTPPEKLSEIVAQVEREERENNTWSQRFTTERGAIDAAAEKDRQFRAEQGEKDRAASADARASDRYAARRDAVTAARDDKVLGGLQTQADGWFWLQPKLQELQGYLDKYPDIFGAVLEADTETAVRKLGRGDPNRIAAIQRVTALGTELSRQELKGQTPVSDLDFKSTLRAQGSNIQNAPGAVAAWLANANREGALHMQRFQAANQYVQRYGGLSMPSSKGGNFYDQMYQGAPAPGAPAPSAPSAPGSQPRAPAAPPPPAGPRVGQTFRSLPDPNALPAGAIVRDASGREYILQRPRGMPARWAPR